MKHILPAVLLLAANARAAGPEAARSGAEAAFSRLDAVGIGAVRRAARSAAAAASAAVPAAPPVRRLRLEVSGVCAGRRLLVPAWCVVEGSEDGATIRVRRGETVELELVATARWGEGVHAFVISAAAPGDCEQQPRPRSLEEACRDFPSFGVSETVAPASARNIRFVADKPGEYKYYDSRRPSGYGLLIVE